MEEHTRPGAGGHGECRPWSYRDLVPPPDPDPGLLLQAIDLNFILRSISVLPRLGMLLLVCVAQAWLMWRFIHSQLRHWREYWKEQSAKRRVSAVPRLPARLLKREPGECHPVAETEWLGSVYLGGKESWDLALKCSTNQSCWFLPL